MIWNSRPVSSACISLRRFPQMRPSAGVIDALISVSGIIGRMGFRWLDGANIGYALYVVASPVYQSALDGVWRGLSEEVKSSTYQLCFEVDITI